MMPNSRCPRLGCRGSMIPAVPYEDGEASCTLCSRRIKITISHLENLETLMSQPPGLPPPTRSEHYDETIRKHQAREKAVERPQNKRQRQSSAA